jgi:hypothetical protein
VSDLRVIILSHKRVGRVTTHKYVAGCEICVPESQADEYAKRYPDLQLLVHPDDVIGAAAKRQWLLDLGVDQFQLDDDMIGLYRIYRRRGAWKKSVVRPDRAREIIEATAETARELGAYLFGFGSHCNPMTYDALRPFRFGGYSPSGAVGILAGTPGCKISIPTETTLPFEDYWLCLINAYHHRYAFYDARFAAGFKLTYIGAGGNAEYRAPSSDGDEPEVLATRYLQKHFGDAIRESEYGSSVVTKRGLNPGRRQIRLPYRHA